MRLWTLCLTLTFAPLCFSGCGTRTVYVQETDPLRLRETIRQAKIWVRDGAGAWVASEADLAEGWYCLSGPSGPKPKGNAPKSPDAVEPSR